MKFIRAPSSRSFNRGSSLIEILVSLTILGIVTLSFATLITAQRKHAEQLAQKLAKLDLERSLTTLLADDGSICTYLLTNPVPAAFDPLQLASLNPLTTMPLIPSKGVAGSDPFIIADKKTPVSPLDYYLVAEQISITDLSCIEVPCTPTSHQFRANLTISFDASKLVVALAPLKFPIILRTTGPANAQSVQECSSARTLKTWVPFSTLKNYHTGAPTDCLGSLNINSLIHLNTACSRWCTIGCTTVSAASNCAAILPGQGYAVGFYSECDGVANQTICNCVR